MKVLWVKKLEDIYKFGDSIGSGTYGSVRRAINLESKERVVCKIVSRKGDYVRELDHLISLRKCYGVLPLKMACFTTSELCLEFEEGDCSLQKYIKERKLSKRKPDEDLLVILYEALSITNQLLITMVHVHTNDIVHRDLKTGNIVMTKDDKGVRAWTIDFGMSKRIIGTEDNRDISHYAIVTATYRAPELWRIPKNIITSKLNESIDEDDDEDENDDDAEYLPVEDDIQNNNNVFSQVPGKINQENIKFPPVVSGKDRIYNSRVDVWSIGCILFEIITGYCPFSADREKDVRRRIAGHILHVAGVHDTILCPEKPKPINIERELDNAIKKIITKGQNKDKERNMDYMDLCSSMEDVFVTPKGTRKVTKRCSSSGPTALSKDCEAMLFVIKKLLRGLLQPDASKRLSAKTALKEFGKYSMKDNSVIGTPVDLSCKRTLNTMARESFMNVIEGAWVACDHLKYHTGVVYLGLYLWIRCITISPELCKEFSLATILLASFRMAISYTGEDIGDLRAFRRLMTKKQQEEKSPRREVNCTSSILTILGGRVWIRNPGDLRHLAIQNCKKGEWDTVVEKTMFSIIMTMLADTFTVPDPDTVVSRTRDRLYQNQNNQSHQTSIQQTQDAEMMDM